MMANTDPEYVSLLFDTGHFTYCGADPLEMVKKYADRIKHVHLKDIRKDMVEKVKKEKLSFLDGVRMGTFTVPGDGDIDFDSIFKVLEESGYTGYMVVEAEQDPAKANPLEYALKARKFISERQDYRRKIQSADKIIQEKYREIFQRDKNGTATKI